VLFVLTQLAFVHILLRPNTGYVADTTHSPTIIVIALFAAFAVLGVRAAMRAPDHFGTLLASGVTVWVVGQAVINIGAVIGILPVTGVPLPFVSFGGSSLVITMAAVGMLANVARQGSAKSVPGAATSVVSSVLG